MFFLRGIPELTNSAMWQFLGHTSHCSSQLHVILAIINTIIVNISIIVIIVIAIYNHFSSLTSEPQLKYQRMYIFWTHQCLQKNVIMGDYVFPPDHWPGFNVHVYNVSLTCEGQVIIYSGFFSNEYWVISSCQESWPLRGLFFCTETCSSATFLSEFRFIWFDPVFHLICRR